MSDGLNEEEFDSLAAEYVLGTLDADERTRANVLIDVDHAFRQKINWWERRLGELHLMVEPVDPDPSLLERIKSKLGDVRQSPEPQLLELERLVEAELAGKPDSAPGSEPVDKPDPVTEIERALEMVRAQEVERKAETSRTSAPETIMREAPSLTPGEPRPRPDVVTDLRPVDEDARRSRALADQRAVAAERTGRGLRRWRLAAVLMTLVAFLLGSLISAWRFAPDRLPTPLRPTTIFNMQQAQTTPPHRPPPPGSEFDE